MRMDLNTIRVFAISKLGWIRSHQRRQRAQEREPAREYLNRESHFVWGRRYLLKVIEADASPFVELRHRAIVLGVRPGANADKREAVLEAWYREQLRKAVPAVLDKWQPLMAVKVRRIFVQRMKTKWGSCRPAAGSIRLNTELAKKPLECLEYIMVHEMVHLLEPTHNTRFLTLMDRFMPRWEFNRSELNRLPVRHEDWGY